MIGHITPAAASVTGLPPGVPVVAGTADMAATLLGSGVYQAGIASDSTGTSTLLTVVSEHPLLCQRQQPAPGQLGLGRLYLLDAGGDAMRWARSALSAGQLSHQQMLDMAAEVPPGAGAAVPAPTLTGERLAEHTNSRAQFFGLQRKHGQPHLYRAVLEGVALASLRNLQQLRRHAQEPEVMIASGGGARSPLWLQIKASVYNLPLLQTRNQGERHYRLRDSRRGRRRAVQQFRPRGEPHRQHRARIYPRSAPTRALPALLRAVRTALPPGATLYEQLDVISSFSFSPDEGTPQ